MKFYLKSVINISMRAKEFLKEAAVKKQTVPFPDEKGQVPAQKNSVIEPIKPIGTPKTTTTKTNKTVPVTAKQQANKTTVTPATTTPIAPAPVVAAKGKGFGDLSPGEFKGNSDRFETFINKIKSKSPFTTIDDEEVVIDPSEASRFVQSWNFKLNRFNDGDKTIRFAKLIKGSSYGGKAEIRLSNLKKTGEFGGAGVEKGKDATTGGKGAFQVKPAHIGICDKDIPATDLYETIVNNSVLKSTEYGRDIIKLAHYIASDESVTASELIQKNDKLRAAVQDNAGEYLGILALIYGRSRFPRIESFKEWLGGDLGSLTLNFPSSETAPLADSFGTLTNKQTQHSVSISSKGKDGGAAPSIKTGLKIPDHIKTNPKLKNGVAFVNMCINESTLNQAFEGIDMLYKIKPKSIDQVWHQFLPFRQRPDLKQAIEANLRGKGGKIPATFKGIIASVDSKEATPGGKILYAMKKEVAEAINEKNALPEFRSMVLEILEMNFIQQYTDYGKKHTGEFTFATQWPAKLDGKITLENKCSAKDPLANAFSFKLGRTDDSVSDGE